MASKFPILGAALAGAGLVILSRKSAAAPAPATPDASDPPLAFPGPLCTASKDELEAAVIRAASQRGCDPVIALAIIDTENEKWDVRAKNTGEKDAKRGGAWGLAQMTHLTALSQDDTTPTKWRSFDDARAPYVLVMRPEIVIELATAHLAALQAASNYGTRSFDAGDVASRYNSGKPLSAAPLSTRTEYVPRFRRNFNRRNGSV